MPSPPTNDPRPVVAHLVMLGTPNGGSTCANPLAGAETLFPNLPTLQLTPGFLRNVFNPIVTDRRGVAFSILAGDRYGPLKVCPGPYINDGVVTIPSAVAIPIAKVVQEPLGHICMTGALAPCAALAHTAFTSFVAPQLALGPTAAKGARYLGPLANVSAGHDLRALRRAAATAHPAPTAERTRSAARLARTTLPCVGAAATPAVSDGASFTTSASHPHDFAISVPAGAGKLTVTVFVAPGATVSLVAPGRQVVQTVSAVTTATVGPFQTLSAASPRAGEWKIEIVDAPGSGANPAAVAVQFAHHPVRVALTAARVTLRSRSSRTTGLRFAARVSDAGHPASAARVTVVLGLLGSTVALHLAPVNGQAGTYMATTTPPGSAATVTVDASVQASSTTAFFKLAGACGAKGAASKPKPRSKSEPRLKAPSAH
jgi:hypothetical protein